MSQKSTWISLEGAINALAKHKDGNQVAVAGRNVFKILNIDGETNEFSEAMNMRVGKNLNLNFSCNDVVWNALEPNLLATGATNGAVVLWNLNRSNRNKLDSVFQDHKRTVNKVCFHSTDPHLLLSGSQDGTIKLFDLRRAEAQATFLSQSESVRDVQFAPFREHCFSAVQENGNVQIWDARRPDHCEKQFTAHSGPVFVNDWHLEQSRLLATAGRDKTIKIWDVFGPKVKIEHCIQTIASVARIKWRPQRTTQIASSSLVVDFSIYIWDYNRPFVPFASFQEHKDVTTDFVWRDSESKRLISAGKDGTVYQHFIKDSDRTGMKINPCGLAIGVGGDISVAFADSLLRNRQSYRQSKMNSSLANVIDPGKSTNLSQSQTALMPTSPPGVTCSISALQQSNSSSNSSINTLPSVSQSNPNASAFSFSAATSTSSLVKRISLFQTSNQNTPSGSLQNSHVRTLSQSIASAAVASGSPATSNRNHVVASGSNTSLISPPKLYSSSLFYLRNDSDNCFVQSALRYELSGQSLSDLCEHNADVAQHLDRPNVAVTWRILKQLYAGQQTQMHSQLSSTTLGLAGDEKQDEFRHRHKSGHASRHPSGSTVTTMNVIIAPNSTLNVSGSSVVSGSVGVANTSGLNSVSAARSTHLSGSGNRRSGNNSGSVASNTVPIASSAVTPRPTSLGPSQSLSLSLKLPDSDSEIEVNDLLPTPTEKEFNREHQDFFFGDGDVSQSVANLTSFDIAPTDNLTHFEDISHALLEIPREAFQLRHPIEEFSFPVDLDLVINEFGAANLVDEDEMTTFDASVKNPRTLNQAPTSQQPSTQHVTQQPNQPQFKLDFNANSLLSAEVGPTSSFKYFDIVGSMLKSYAQDGDVQTACSILLVLGDRAKTIIETSVQEIWFQSYIELLCRFQLWNVKNQVIKLSVLPTINTLNQLSTSIYTSCSSCGRQLTNRVAWLCDRCKTSTSTCSVCHEVVKGVYVWCQGCSHGGHIEHMGQWFKLHRYCPTGCGHLCEYS